MNRRKRRQRSVRTEREAVARHPNVRTLYISRGLLSPRFNGSRSCGPGEFFVSFVCFCSKTRPTTCTRYSPKLTDSPVRSSTPPSKCIGSWGQDCWRASTSVAHCASSSYEAFPLSIRRKSSSTTRHRVQGEVEVRFARRRLSSR